MRAPEHSVVCAIALCLVGAAVTWALRNRRTAAAWTCLGVTAASAVCIAAAVLHVGQTAASGMHTARNWGLGLRLGVDGLSAVFLGLAALIAVPAAAFSVRYLERYPAACTRSYSSHLLIFLAAMYGLVSTTDMLWFFFVFWQLMTWPGFALIRFEYERPESRAAAWRYLWMMQLACAATLVGAVLLAHHVPATASSGAAYDFSHVRAALPALLAEHPRIAAAAFLLFLVGFGIKMGMWPFGALWLPAAHPAAPSPVSALLSGVMIKTGVYGLLRYFVWLVPPEAAAAYPSRVWGGLLALLGTLTLCTGTWQALRQEHTKRLLAFHSIGQVGYILLGVGVALALANAPGDARALAGIALFGALFHTVNHACFKALLFFNAGALLYHTGTQNLNRMGGLFRVLPVTALTALGASWAISGLPPFNGFASKWALYASTALGDRQLPGLVCCALVALLTSALTLASFVKFFGTAFLGRPALASPVPAAPTLQGEVPGSLRWPQVFLALVCLWLGLSPGLAWQAMVWVMAHSRDGLASGIADALPALHSPLGGLALPAGRAVMLPVAIALIPALLVLMLSRLGRPGRQQRREARPWHCGQPPSEIRPNYGAHHFYQPLKQFLHPPPPAPNPASRRDRPGCQEEPRT